MRATPRRSALPLPHPQPPPPHLVEQVQRDDELARRRAAEDGVRAELVLQRRLRPGGQRREVALRRGGWDRAGVGGGGTVRGLGACRGTPSCPAAPWPCASLPPPQTRPPNPPTPMVKFWMNISYFSGELMLPTMADRFIGLLPVLCALTTTLIWGGARAAGGGRGVGPSAVGPLAKRGALGAIARALRGALRGRRARLGRRRHCGNRSRAPRAAHDVARGDLLVRVLGEVVHDSQVAGGWQIAKQVAGPLGQDACGGPSAAGRAQGAFRGRCSPSPGAMGLRDGCPVLRPRAHLAAARPPPRPGGRPATTAPSDQAARRRGAWSRQRTS
jgi:hypothetical protein